MTRKQALEELLVVLEGGVKYETMGHTIMCQKAFPKPDDFNHSREAFSKSAAQQAILVWRNDSLDAAKAVHKAVIHERVAVLLTWSDRYGATVKLLDPIGQNEWVGGVESDSPSRAWLIAIIKALKDQEQ